MSDDDDVVLVKKPKQVHYGSLEEQEKARLAALAAAAKEGAEDNGGKDLGDIQVSSEYMELEEEMSRDKKALLEEFERRRKARQLNVSTDDDEVRRSLRQLGEPVCLLGEDAIHKKLEEEEARIERDRGREGTWYHEGPPELREARLWIARYSLPKAKLRLYQAREDLKLAGSVRAAAKQESQRKAAAVAIYCSQLATDSENPMEIETAAVPEPAVVMQDTEGVSESCTMATCAYDGTVYLWNFKSESPLCSLDGHSPARVARLDFHPSGRFLATTVFDHSWRLWDLETATEVMSADISYDNKFIATCSYDRTFKLWAPDLA
ncbi:hypothetical protein HF086_004528 [Spodoptera exigua]|uniref:Pre-mRNA processing factor 4 (PRP4)-like domain-containing protein n=1 Tax=Spodoptera exigua TaxID=7107 RepID=A0A922M9E7_SPOEX|nr:hypothetical protein HF086_004528 [Spodoptera exigua]